METLLHQIKHHPETVGFKQVIETINQHYDYSPAGFTNGLGKDTLHNAPGQNEAPAVYLPLRKDKIFRKPKCLLALGSIIAWMSYSTRKATITRIFAIS